MRSICDHWRSIGCQRGVLLCASDEARPPLEGVLVPLAASDDGRVLIMHEDEDAAGADPPWLRGLLRWGNIHVVR